jgi:hypothetical protein
MTRCVFEKVAQNAAQSAYCENFHISVTAEKVSQKTTQRKKSPNRRKFAQSGHPDCQTFPKQGCHTRIFEPKVAIWEKLWRVLQGKVLVCYMNICTILLPFRIHFLWSFGIFYGHLVCLIPFWYVVPRKTWQSCRQSCV